MRQTCGFSHHAVSQNESADAGCSFPLNLPSLKLKWNFTKIDWFVIDIFDDNIVGFFAAVV